MLYGISGAPLPDAFPYKAEIEKACSEYDIPPCFAGGVAWRETLGSASWILATYGTSPTCTVSEDGGHGIFQLTSYVPSDWSDPFTNALAAAHVYFKPDLYRWHSIFNLSGDDLVKCAAASFNAGWDQASQWHEDGDVDAYTTRQNGVPYGEGVLANYHALVAGHLPS